MPLAELSWGRWLPEPVAADDGWVKVVNLTSSMAEVDGGLACFAVAAAVCV